MWKVMKLKCYVMVSVVKVNNSWLNDDCSTIYFCSSSSWLHFTGHSGSDTKPDLLVNSKFKPCNYIPTFTWYVRG